MNPQDLLYTKTHEWTHVATDESGQKIATVGLATFALEALTDLIFIELPEVGREVEAGKPFGEIESVKAVSDLYSPVNGEVVDINTKLADQLEDLPKDPYGNGWMVKIKVTDESSLSQLMDYPTYQKHCEEEA